MLNMTMQFNRRRFINEILNKDFLGDTKKCAIALGVDPDYFSRMIFIPTKNGGIKLLGGVYRYCEKTGRNPRLFIFND